MMRGDQALFLDPAQSFANDAAQGGIRQRLVTDIVLGHAFRTGWAETKRGG